MMRLVFLHGPAACGKLTIARELAALSGLRLFHNHLTVDLVASLFEFGSPPFNRLRELIWTRAFSEAAREGRSLVFTFQPEASVSPDFPARVASEVGAQGGEVLFVELACSEGEIERRIESRSRREFGKLRSLPEYHRLRDAGAFRFPPLPEPALRIDTTSQPPRESARQIAELLQARSVGPG